MVEIINLRRARKAKARAGKERAAEVNRAAFGRGKLERDKSAAEEALQRRRLDGQLREKADESGKPE